MRKVISLALEEVGYAEKETNANLDNEVENAGDSNYTKYARDLDAIEGFYNGRKQGQPWCATFVDWLFVQAYGVEKAKAMTFHSELGARCDYAANAYRAAGRWYSTPEVGDEIFFKSASYTHAHTGIVVEVTPSEVITVEGNTRPTQGVVYNGGEVCKKSYALDYHNIIGYGRPNYESEESMVQKRVYLSPSDQVANTYAWGNTNEAIQCGYIAEASRRALERSGVLVMVGQYKSMEVRCKESDDFKADLYAPIHTNAFNKKVMGTRIFSYDTVGKGWQYAQEVFKALAPLTPGTSENVKAAPQLYEVKTPKAPTVYTEVEFHDTVEGAKWIVEHTIDIGEKHAEGICNALGVKFVPVQSADTGEDVVSREEYNALYASTDALITRLKNAIEIFEKGKE